MLAMINCEIIVGQVGRRFFFDQRTAWTFRFPQIAFSSTGYGSLKQRATRRSGREWKIKHCAPRFRLVLLYQFGEVNDFLCVGDFGAVAQPIADVSLVHEAPLPLLRELAGVAGRHKHRLSADIHLHAVFVPHWSMEDLHRLQVVAEVLIALPIMTSVRLHVPSLANAVAIKAVLHVRQRNIPVVPQRKVLVILRSFPVLSTIVNAWNR